MAKIKRMFTLKQVLMVAFSTIVGSAVTTAITLIGLANTDHFIIAANTGRIETLESVIVPRNEFNRFENEVYRRFDSVDGNFNSLQKLILDYFRINK